jgi:hypothetical protein
MYILYTVYRYYRTVCVSPRFAGPTADAAPYVTNNVAAQAAYHAVFEPDLTLPGALTPSGLKVITNSKSYENGFCSIVVSGVPGPQKNAPRG